MATETKNNSPLEQLCGPTKTQMNASATVKKTEKRNPFLGSSVDDFFAADGLLEEIEAAAIKRVIALGLQLELDRKQMTKTELARRLDTSRSQLDRILDPSNESITLNTLMKGAALLGKRLHVSLERATPA